MKGKIIGLFITIVISFVLFFVGMDSRMAGTPIEVYQVYLDGKKIGLVSSKDDLLNLIDTEQAAIKKEYGVDKVYPPNGLSIQKVYTYSDDISSVQSIYDKVNNIEPFTIEGYTVTITYTEQKVNNDEEVLEPAPPKKIYMLDKSYIEEALYNTAEAFIGTKDLKNYDEGIKKEITETGYTLNSVFFEETITVRKDYVSTKEYIFKDSKELSRYLLFGTLETQKNYVTKDGENLDAIAENNRLSIEELLIANPQYSSKDVLLTAGEKVNVGLINPLVSVVYSKTVVDDIDVAFKTEIEKDKTKYSDYEEVKVKGQNGITRITQEVKYINGEINSLKITQREIIKDAIPKVIVKGTKSIGGNGYIYVPDYDGTKDYSWPTVSPFIITSKFKWRWGRHHNGIDIVAGVGGGYGSPIYAVRQGVVYKVNRNRYKSEGLSVYVLHDTGMVSVYMHLSKILVSEGQEVKREQKIGKMGNTGVVTGTHLHLGVYEGKPYQGGVVKDPCKSMFTC